MYTPEIKSDKLSNKQVLGLMILAYAFSFLIRMIWIYQFQDNPSFFWNGQLMINTNDGYFFASGTQHALSQMHQHNPRIPDISAYSLVFFTTLLTKYTPLSLETVILYMPAIVSSLVIVPIILIAKLYEKTFWGFFAALLGSIAWSYYNRTMVGYFDTDMFSAMAPMFILYFLMKSTIDFNLRSALYAALFIAIYPFLYDQGKAIVYAMGLIYAAYMIFYHRDEKITYISLVLVFFALIPLPLAAPMNYIAKIILLIGVYLVFQKVSIEQKKLMFVAGTLFVLFMIFGNALQLIYSKVSGYLFTGTQIEGLHFYGVKQTVREAGKIPFEVFANRISGSQLGVILSLVGYVVLVIKHRAFILALPLIGIGIFALWGGLRFTVYAVPVAAMSAIYLFYIIGEYFRDQRFKYAFVTMATAAMLYPNITHIIDYKVPTVLNKEEVQDLEKLQKIANSRDYTLSWWDYGYPIWFYSGTSTLIDGGKHNNDNFIISKILQTSSQELAANLSRVAVETYVSSGYKVVADTLFKNKKQDQADPNLLLAELGLASYKVPEKTRDIYLYLPYRMMNIFPTVTVFGNLDLTTGKALRDMVFYPTKAVDNTQGILRFANRIQFDVKTGELLFGQEKEKVKHFIVTQNTQEGKVLLQSQLYHTDGKYAVVYMKSYGQFIVMDIQTFHSSYVQMFILEKYDKSLFELVVSSPYSKIYRLKR